MEHAVFLVFVIVILNLTNKTNLVAVLNFFQERGSEKERQFALQILQRQLEEETARIPKASPYPYTTDYPVVQSSNPDDLQAIF